MSRNLSVANTAISSANNKGIQFMSQCPVKGTSRHVRPIETSDQPAHAHNLIRVFGGCSMDRFSIKTADQGKCIHTCVALLESTERRE